MDVQLVGFVEALRQNGVRVGASEVLDATRAALEVGIEERSTFRSALQATLVKRSADVGVFLRVFDVYFSGAYDTLQRLDQSLMRQIEERGLLQGDDLQMVIYTLARYRDEMSPLTQQLVDGDATGLASMLRGAVLSLDLSRFDTSMQSGFFSRRLALGLGVEQTRKEFSAMETELHRRGVSAEGVEIVSRALGDALREVEALTREEIAREKEARVKKIGDVLSERPFQSMSAADVKQAEVAVKRLAEKLKARLTLRARSKRRGLLHVRRTLRKNLATGGVPMVPHFRRKRPLRPDVVVLCDVSESVRTASRLMLLFAYTLQSLFSRVRSFAFVADVAETTEVFRSRSLDAAMQEVTSGRVLSMQANSNYGQVFERFGRRFLPSLTRRTTVIVIGDGRNNHNPANLRALEDIRRAAKRLLWISPEEKRAWGFGDSELQRYAKVCTRVEVVQSLEDLERLATTLVPR